MRLLLFALSAFTLVCLGAEWSDFDIRAGGIDAFGRNIVKNCEYRPHFVRIDDDLTLQLPQVLNVLDGDTFRLILQYHGVERARGTWDEIIRIADIDAPELSKKQPYAEAARKRLFGLIHGRLTKVVPLKRDRYYRVLADVFTEDGKNVALILIREGFVRCYSTCKRREYLDAEAQAQREKRGIWSGQSAD